MEYGPDIYAITDDLVRDVADDLTGIPEYAGCETTAFAPEPVPPFRKVKRYGYVMTGQVIPPNAPENILIEYGVIEENERRRVHTGTAIRICRRNRSRL